MTVNRWLIPPGPWTARGNAVLDGHGQTIAVIFYKHYPLEIARFIVELNEQTDLRFAQDRIEELLQEKAALEKEVEEMDSGVNDSESGR